MKKTTIVLVAIFVLGGVPFIMSGGHLAVDPEFDNAMQMSRKIQQEESEIRPQSVDTHKVLSQMRMLDTIKNNTKVVSEKKKLYVENFFFTKMPNSNGGDENELLHILTTRMNGIKKGEFNFLYSPFEQGIISKEMLEANPSYRVTVSSGEFALYELHPATGKTKEIMGEEKKQILSILCKVTSS